MNNMFLRTTFSFWTWYFNNKQTKKLLYIPFVIPLWTTWSYAPPSNFELGISTAYKQKSCYSIMNNMFLRTTFSFWTWYFNNKQTKKVLFHYEQHVLPTTF